jgi:hypothetical protein
MAQRVVLDDDIDGTPAEETLRFAVDGRDMEIDLNKAHLAEFYKMIEPFVANARELKDRLPPPSVRAYRAAAHKPGLGPWFVDNGITAADVRIWCQQNGIPVNVMGRIPADIAQQYENAHRMSARKQEKLQTVYSDPVLQPFSGASKK